MLHHGKGWESRANKNFPPLAHSVLEGGHLSRKALSVMACLVTQVGFVPLFSLHN